MKPETLPKNIKKLIEAAVVYFENGKPQIAADRLRAAADAAQKNAKISKALSLSRSACIPASYK